VSPDAFAACAACAGTIDAAAQSRSNCGFSGASFSSMSHWANDDLETGQATGETSALCAAGLGQPGRLGRRSGVRIVEVARRRDEGRGTARSLASGWRLGNLAWWRICTCSMLRTVVLTDGQ
jgi:hypothetical protein